MLFTYHQLLINAKITLIRVYLIFFLLWPKLHQLRLQYKNIVKKRSRSRLYGCNGFIFPFLCLNGLIADHFIDFYIVASLVIVVVMVIIMIFPINYSNFQHTIRSCYTEYYLYNKINKFPNIQYVAVSQKSNKKIVWL